MTKVSTLGSRNKRRSNGTATVPISEERKKYFAFIWPVVVVVVIISFRLVVCERLALSL